MFLIFLFYRCWVPRQWLERDLKVAVSQWIPLTGKDNFAIPYHSRPGLVRLFNLKFHIGLFCKIVKKKLLYLPLPDPCHDIPTAPAGLVPLEITEGFRRFFDKSTAFGQSE